MEKNLIYYILLFLLMISVINCKKGDNPTSSESLFPFLYGQVTDTQGKSLDSVGIHYIFSTVTSGLLKISKTCPSTTISFTVPQRARVSLKIYRWYTQEFIETLLDTMKNAGAYSVQLNLTNLTNGCYFYRLAIDTAVAEKLMWLLDTDVSTLINTLPLVTSNSTGQFALPLGIFGVGMKIFATGSTPTDIDTVYISHVIQLILHKNGYKTLSYPLTIDTMKGIQQVFKLEK